MLWFGEPALLIEKILPIAILDSPCICREAALASIQKAGLPYRVVLETPNLSVLRAAVDAGVAITCRPAAFSDTGCSVLQIPSLPLPKVAYSIYSKKSHPTIERLVGLLEAAVKEL
jgi:DNA-binding transcriptional LysR family regulator